MDTKTITGICLDSKSSSRATNRSSSGVRSAVGNFFHARAGPEACILGGWMRISFAVLYIADRLLWTLDLEQFFYQDGIIPARVGLRLFEQEPSYTIFYLAPESDLLVWAVHYGGILQGVLLLLGIAPRFQMVSIFLHLVSWQRHNNVCWFGQDDMFRIWAFLMCFLPLHRLTLTEWWHTTRGLGQAQHQERHMDDSWPMWPFRLWQIQIGFLYSGAGISKLSGETWRNGSAVFRTTFVNDFYGGVFNPDFLFGRVGPLKILTWSSLAMENVAYILLCFQATRIPVLISVIAFHIGIDLSMNMHCFEWLTILGLLPFLVMPAPPPFRGKTQKTLPTKFHRWIANAFLALFLFLSASQTLPIVFIEMLLPAAAASCLQPLFTCFSTMQETLFPLASMAGIYQPVWSMYAPDPENRNNRYEVRLKFLNDTEASWWSEDSSNMTWLEKKRYQRILDYYAYAMYPDTPRMDIAQSHFCHYVAREYGDLESIESIELVNHWEYGYGEIPPGLSWFDPVKQEALEQGQTRLLKLKLVGGADPTDVEFGSRITVYSFSEEVYYNATVIEKWDGSAEFLLRWDEDVYEDSWVDLDIHWFRFLSEQEGDKTEYGDQGSIRDEL